MTTITPPPPPIPPQGTPRPLPTVVVANPTAALIALSTGAKFEGTVVTEGSPTTVQVSTVHGTLQFQTTLPLAQGAKLDLTLQNLAPQIQLQISAIDGKPPHLTVRIPASSPTPAGIGAPGPALGTPTGGPSLANARAAGAVPNTPNPQALTGTTVVATLLRPQGSFAKAATGVPAGNQLKTSASHTAANPVPPAGSRIAATPAGRTISPNTMSPGVQTAAATPQAGTAPAQAGTATPQAGTALPLAQGTRIPVRVTAVHMPGTGSPTPQAARAPFLGMPPIGQPFVAKVTGNTASGQPIAQSPLGPIALATNTPLPRGATVMLEVAGRAVHPESAAARQTPLPLSLFRAPQWQTFREAYQAMQELNPAATQHTMANVLPRPDAHLAANVLFFLSALRGGDISGWLGDPLTRILQRAQPHLATRLRDEFGQLATMAREPMAGDWRIALIPLLNGPDIEQLRLYLKPYGGEEGNDDNSKGVRFIIDVDLSRLGRIQLDGLARDNKNRVDLIVRSEELFPAEMQNDIRAIFEEANALTGKSGGLSFQAKPPDFVDVSPASGADESPSLFA